MELKDEARLRFDEVRILVSARERLDAHLVSAHFPRNRRKVLGGRYDLDLRVRARSARRQGADDNHERKQSFHDGTPSLK
jgi:hypothetical protein